MLSEFLVLLKSPVTAIKGAADEKNIKKEAIIVAVVAVIIALVSILNTYFGEMKIINKTFKSLDDYNESLYPWQEEVTKSEFKKMKKEAKKEAFEDAELGKAFFKTFAYTAITILVISGMLYIIARVMKDPKDFMEMLAMSNRAAIIYALGLILNFILTRIYAPIGVIVLLVSIVYAIISLANAFKESISLADPDKYVIASTAVIGVVIAILVFIVNNYLSSLFSLF